MKCVCSACKRWAVYLPALNIHRCTGCGREVTDEEVYKKLRIHFV